MSLSLLAAATRSFTLAKPAEVLATKNKDWLPAWMIGVK